jgi:hypothetical protein
MFVAPLCQVALEVRPYSFVVFIWAVSPKVIAIVQVVLYAIAAKTLD